MANPKYYMKAILCITMCILKFRVLIKRISIIIPIDCSKIHRWFNDFRCGQAVQTNLMQIVWGEIEEITPERADKIHDLVISDRRVKTR